MIRDLLLKKPFVRVLPDYSAMTGELCTLDKVAVTENHTGYVRMRQSDFIRELYPSGHKINSELYYPNKIKYDEEQKRFFEQKVVRCAFPFQRIILTQQLTHLCGNDVHIESTNATYSEEEKRTLREIKKGWLDKNMEIAVYELAKSVKATGDGAIVMYMHKGKQRYKSLSFLHGDILYPHYNSNTGELDCFARQYSDYDASGKAITTWVEVWDDKCLTRFQQSLTGVKAVVTKLKEFFGLDGYEQVGQPERHSFDEVPVVYVRDDNGPCWSDVQDPIEKYELAVSHLCQNNMAYAFPIMILKGENVEIKGDMYGDVKAITMASEDSAQYLAPADASKSFEIQLSTLLRMIFMGSFIVQPPELKSGDLPGVAIKLIYSPSLEKAMIDAKEFDPAIDKLVRLFKFGFGIETGKFSKITSLPTFSWIEPYVHQNTSELVNNLVALHNANLLSIETGCGLSTFGENDEFDKIMREYKEQQAADLLLDLGNGAIGENSTTANQQALQD